MQLSAKEAWKRILDEAHRELPDHTIRTWLEPTEAIALDEGRLIVGAPDQFAVEWNETKHAPLLSKLAEPLLGKPTSIVFRVHEDRQKRPQMDFFVAPTAAPGGRNDGDAVRPAGNSSTQPLNERYTFDTFVIGKSNELAAAAAHAAAESPGKTYNPLFIYGATGLGKTHLMQAIAHTVCERQPETRVLYVGAEQFINEVIESIHSRTMPEFRRRYRTDVDLFLVDDVHFLEGKEMTQEEFFHTFNALYEGNKQIVLTSDRPPKEIPGLEARLVSRFEWGMVADIGSPDLEHRIAILRKKQEQDHLEMTSRTTSSGSSPSTSGPTSGSWRGASSSCCSTPRSSTRRSRSSWPGRRCPTGSGPARSRARRRGPCHRSTRSRRSWPGAGGSLPRGFGPRRGSRP